VHESGSKYNLLAASCLLGVLTNCEDGGYIFIWNMHYLSSGYKLLYSKVRILCNSCCENLNSIEKEFLEVYVITTNQLEIVIIQHTSKFSGQTIIFSICFVRMWNIQQYKDRQDFLRRTIIYSPLKSLGLHKKIMTTVIVLLLHMLPQEHVYKSMPSSNGEEKHIDKQTAR
jgi:hypothetical protein